MFLPSGQVIWTTQKLYQKKLPDHGKIRIFVAVYY